MKKFIAACLSILVGTFGYTIAETAIDTRVANLEAECSSLKEVVSDLCELHNISTSEPTTPIVSEYMNETEFATFINAETAKIANNGQYTVTRESEYITPLDVGGATDILNKIVQAIDETSSLEQVVAGFLDIGTVKADIPNTNIKSDYKIKATSLTAEDIEDLSFKNGKYTFTLAKATNPKKAGTAPLSRFTNDFITQDEVTNSISSYTTAIKINSTTFNYSNIKVEVTVSNDKITNIRYSYVFDANAAIKAVVTINGSCTVETNSSYTNILY